MKVRQKNIDQSFIAYKLSYLVAFYVMYGFFSFEYVYLTIYGLNIVLFK